MSNDDKPSYRGGPIIAVAAGLLLFVGYVGAYFGSSNVTGSWVPIRNFNASWQVQFFWPALLIEKRIRGDLFVSVTLREPFGVFVPVQPVP